MKKVVIIGCGPAGMFAAYKLAGDFDVTIVEKGEDVDKRKSIICGVGGAGTFSDGTLNLSPDIGGSLSDFTDENTSWDLVKEVDRIFVKYGVPVKSQNYNKASVEKLKLRAASKGAEFVGIHQKHIGSDATPQVIKKFKIDLEKRGVKFLLNTEVKDLSIENGVCQGVVLSGGRIIGCDYAVLAPGRSGFEFVGNMAKKHNIDYDYGSIDVGVRVEVPAIVMKPITLINRDPKFYIWTPTYDDFVRTFCVNENGFVVKEKYEEFVLVNGHSLKNSQSENTNFAFLVRVSLTKPLENTTKYGRSIAKLATTIGGGKPIVQRIGDLRRGRRSTWRQIKRNYVGNTLEEVTPGDISMALPHRIVTDIEEGLDVLDKIIPGIASNSTLLYAPEIKFYALRLRVHQGMETGIKNLYAAGDGVGLSRDIVNAAATGILAAWGIARKARPEARNKA